MSRKPLPVHARFWPKVEKSPMCWEWRAARNPNGYGVFFDGVRMTYSHRVAYELCVGPIPIGMTVDHRCHNKGCVNPEHFEIVSLGENGRRGNLERRIYRLQTRCKNGHDMAGDNIHLDLLGQRSCRSCRNARNRERRKAAKT